MNAIIVDDESLARRGIRESLDRYPEIRVVAECANGADAIHEICEKHPDLVFLDIQMPLMDGFEVIQLLEPEQIPYVIFVTAHDEYAVQAFEINAMDYLLKPVEERRFDAALQRAKTAIQQNQAYKVREGIVSLLESMKERKRYSDRIAIRENGRILFVRTNEIDWIESQGNYLEIHAGKTTHILRQTISGLEEQLDPEDFARIHRSTIVRLDRVQEMKMSFPGANKIVLRDGTQLFLSRRFRDKLRQRIG